MFKTCRTRVERRARLPVQPCPQSCRTTPPLSFRSAAQSQSWSCCRNRHRQSRYYWRGSCPSCSRKWRGEAAWRRFRGVRTRQRLERIGSPRCLQINQHTTTSVAQVEQMRTVTGNDQKLIVVGQVMNSDVRESGDDLLLRWKICAFLELEVSNGSRKSQVAVHTAKINKSTGGAYSCLLACIVSACTGQEAYDPSSHPRSAACGRMTEALLCPLHPALFSSHRHFPVPSAVVDFRLQPRHTQ